MTYPPPKNLSEDLLSTNSLSDLGTSSQTTNTASSLAASEKAMTAPQQDGEPSGGGEQSNENESMELNQNQNLPSEVTLRLWNDVAQGIDKNSTGEESERQSMNTYSIACF